MTRQHSPTDDLQALRDVFSQDHALSAPERAVLAVLVLHRNGESGQCDPSLTRIAREAGVGRRTAMRSLASLEEAGHVRRDVQRDGRTRTSYTVHPPTRATVALGPQSHQGQSGPRLGPQSHQTRATVAPERTKERTKERTSNISADRFDAFWTAYPKRAGGNPKGRARTAWNARMKEGAAPDAIMDGLGRYRAYLEATGNVATPYVLQAATFVGPDRRWEDDWTPPKPSGNGRPGGRYDDTPQVDPNGPWAEKPGHRSGFVIEE